MCDVNAASPADGEIVARLTNRGLIGTRQELNSMDDEARWDEYLRVLYGLSPDVDTTAIKKHLPDELRRYRR